MGKHPGSIDRHGDKWRIRLCVNRKRHTYSLDGGLSREKVEERAQEEHDKLVAEEDRKARGLPDRKRMSELLDDYRRDVLPTLAPNTVKAYETTLQAVETYFGDQLNDPQAHEVSKGHVSQFLKWRRLHAPDGSRYRKPLAARTVEKDRIVLGVVFSAAETDEVVDSNPVQQVKPVKGDSREPLYIGDAEYEALLRACEERDMLHLYALVLGETGVRCDSEALWLRWQDVDLESGFLTIESVRKGRRTKSGKSRKVPMSSRLRRAMREHMARYRMKLYNGQRTEWVFHHELDRRHAKAGDRLGSFRRAFNGAVKRAGLPTELRQHDLRHRRVKTWLDEGHPVHIVQQAMGHAHISTTMGYYEYTEDPLRQLMDSPPEEVGKLASEG